MLACIVGSNTTQFLSITSICIVIAPPSLTVALSRMPKSLRTAQAAIYVSGRK